MTSIHEGEAVIVVLGKIVGVGSAIIFAFLFGGFLMGVVFAIPSYFISLKFFQFIEHWRIGIRERNRGESNIKRQEKWVPTK